ncbi:DUF3330 domain-containing protein, partial [Cupriavidus basilensis]
AAFTPEGAEYVEHFCGLECYQRFEAQAHRLRPRQQLRPEPRTAARTDPGG